MDVKPEHLLSTKNQVFNFAPKQIFGKSQPKACILQLLDECIELFPKDITSFLRIILTMFADGFSVQRGNIFASGPNSEDDTKGPNK